MVLAPALIALAPPGPLYLYHTLPHFLQRLCHMLVG